MKTGDCLKWVATLTLIVATVFLNLGYVDIGRILFFAGGVFWFIVSVLWREPALIITNAAMLLATIVATTFHFITTGKI